MSLPSAILETVPTGVVAADRAGGLCYANAAARRLLGLTSPPARADLADLLGGGPDLRRALSRFSASGESRHEARCPDGNGGARLVGLTVVRPAASDADQLGAVVLFRDVSERRLAVAEAEKLERWWALGRLVADMAHEMRNPLAALQFLTEALAVELSSEVRAGGYIGRILAAVARIDALVSSAIAYAEPAAPRPRRLPLSGVIERALRAVGGPVGIRRVGPPDLDPVVEVDPEQVASSLAELLENALEATGNPRRVALRSSSQREPHGRRVARVEVVDDGPGIDRESLARVFDPFFTTHARRTGMGLAFAEMLVRQNGGRISARSTPGRETVFALDLPEATA